MARREEAVQLYDERFARMWEFYLAASEMSFRKQNLMNFQIQLTKRQGVVPMTRDYITREEAKLRGLRARQPAAAENRGRIGLVAQAEGGSAVRIGRRPRQLRPYRRQQHLVVGQCAHFRPGNLLHGVDQHRQPLPLAPARSPWLKPLVHCLDSEPP